jgi:hypothetical protein
MPNAFDRRIPDDNMSPLRALNYDDIRTTAQNAGEQMRDFMTQAIANIEKIVEDIFRETGVNLYTLFYDIAHAITGRLDDLIDLDTVGLWSGDLRKMLANPPDWGSGDVDIIAWAIRFVEEILLPTGLFGEIADALRRSFAAAYVSIGNIGREALELLVQPLFNSAQSIDGGGFWLWDSAVSYLGGPGSATTTVGAIRIGRELVSDPEVPVANNQQVSASCRVKWAGVTAADTTSPVVQVAVMFYDDAGEVVSRKLIASVTNPAPDSDWVEVTGVYDIADDEHADLFSMRLALIVTEAATAGQFWFSASSMKATGVLLPEFVTGLPQTMQSLIDLFWELGAGIPTIAAITERFKNIWSTGHLDAVWLKNFAPITTIPTHLIDLMNTPAMALIVDGISNFLGFLPDPVANAGQDLANQAMNDLFNSLAQSAQAIQALLQQNTAGDSATPGATFKSVTFNQYWPGALPSAEFTVTYTGAGLSNIILAGGVSTWTLIAGGDRRGFVTYTAAPTVGDNQRVGITIRSKPAYGASKYVLARANTTGSYCVYARFYTDIFMALYAELGCYVNGVLHVWAPGVKMAAGNASFYLLAGSSANARQCTVLAGAAPVVSYTDSAAQSAMGAGYRYWGYGGATGGVGTLIPGAELAISGADS